MFDIFNFATVIFLNLNMKNEKCHFLASVLHILSTKFYKTKYDVFINNSKFTYFEEPIYL